MLPLCLFSDDTSGNRYTYTLLYMNDIVRPQFYLIQKFLGGNGRKAIMMGHLSSPRGWVLEGPSHKSNIILRFIKRPPKLHLRPIKRMHRERKFRGWRYAYSCMYFRIAKCHTGQRSGTRFTLLAGLPWHENSILENIHCLNRASPLEMAQPLVEQLISLEIEEVFDSYYT